MKKRNRIQHILALILFSLTASFVTNQEGAAAYQKESCEGGISVDSFHISTPYDTSFRFPHSYDSYLVASAILENIYSNYDNNGLHTTPRDSTIMDAQEWASASFAFRQYYVNQTTLYLFSKKPFFALHPGEWTTALGERYQLSFSTSKIKIGSEEYSSQHDESNQIYTPAELCFENDEEGSPQRVFYRR